MGFVAWTRKSMQGNRSRDTKPEMVVRSAVLDEASGSGCRRGPSRS